MTFQGKKIKILHVFPDDKFFDGVANYFIELHNVTNLFYYYSKDNKPFRYIKNKEIITQYSNWSEYISFFKDPSIDIIYFHSLPINNYKLFKHIDSRKIIIWWCWGYDIYNNYGILKPFIDIDIYKPLTEKISKKVLSLKTIYHFIRSLTLYKKRNIILNRIDYFSPVIPIEYELMKNNSAFRAKPFMLEKGPGLGYKIKGDYTYKSKAQNIIIGNSLTLTNNHLDILDKIKDIKLSDDRTYIVPINYGNGFDKNILKHKAQTISAPFRWLDSFIPKNEYIELFQTISHAIFGHMRQQAMGNINICLRNGIKVFLYKDSIIYKQLKSQGYHVFTIDYDLNEKSLSETLTEEAAIHNYELYYHIGNNKIEKTIAELQAMIKNKL